MIGVNAGGHWIELFTMLDRWKKLVWLKCVQAERRRHWHYWSALATAPAETSAQAKKAFTLNNIFSSQQPKIMLIFMNSAKKMLWFHQLVKYFSIFTNWSIQKIWNFFRKNSQQNITEASLAQGICQLYCTKSWSGVHKVHNVVQLGLSHKFEWGFQTPA